MDLVNAKGHKYFLSVLQDPSVDVSLFSYYIYCYKCHIMYVCLPMSCQMTNVITMNGNVIFENK